MIVAINHANFISDLLWLEIFHLLFLKIIFHSLFIPFISLIFIFYEYLQYLMVLVHC